MKKMIPALVAAAGLMAGAAWADQGTTAASFLKLATGPRAIAMGGSFAGLADDVNALNYNASGLAYLNDKEITLMHAIWFQDIYYDNGAVAWPIHNIGTLGLNVLYLNAGTFDGYTLDASGNPQSTGTFGASDMALGLAFARQVIPNISAGLLVKYISETIDGTSDGGVAVDISGLYHTPLPGLSLGANIQNLGPAIGFNNTYSLPINFRLGVGYKPMKNVAVDMDYTQPIETAGVLSIGGEYGYRDFFYARGGYQYQGAIDYNQTYVGYGPSVAAGLSLGLGFKLYQHYLLDFAYVPFGFLGNTYRFSFTYKFE